MRLVLLCFLATLAACSQSAPPPTAPVERPVQRAPAPPPGKTLGDVVDDANARKKLVDELEEVEKTQP